MSADGAAAIRIVLLRTTIQQYMTSLIKRTPEYQEKLPGHKLLMIRCRILISCLDRMSARASPLLGHS